MSTVPFVTFHFIITHVHSIFKAQTGNKFKCKWNVRQNIKTLAVSWWLYGSRPTTISWSIKRSDMHGGLHRITVVSCLFWRQTSGNAGNVQSTVSNWHGWLLCHRSWTRVQNWQSRTIVGTICWGCRLDWLITPRLKISAPCRQQNTTLHFTQT